MIPLQLVKGQNVALDPEIKNLKLSVRWTAVSSAANVDLVALLVGSDRRVRSDADMIFYNQTSTADGSVVHAGKVAGNGKGSDEVSVDISSLAEDVDGLTVAASTDGAPFGDLQELSWSLVLETGEVALNYSVTGLTTERALVLGELYRRSGTWRVRAVGQGWEGGLAGLATDYGVSIEQGDGVADSVDPVADNAEFDLTELDILEVDTRIDPVDELGPTTGTAVPVEICSAKGNPEQSAATQSPSAEPSTTEAVRPGVVPSASGRVRVAATKSVKLPTSQLAEEQSWQPSRLFSISGIGGIDEQEKRATSALMWAMSAVRPLGRALTARATAPVGPLETFIEVGFPLGEHRVIPDGVIRIARGGRIWTALVEVKTGEAVLHREQIESYLRLARRRKFDVVLTISNEVSTDPDIHPIELPDHITKNVVLVHLSWSEVMHEIRMLLSHHQFTEILPMWILSELLKYLEHPRSGAMSFHDMGPTWVPTREAVLRGTLRATDTNAEPVVLAWQRLVRQLSLGLTARLGVTVKQSLHRRLINDPDLRVRETAQLLEESGSLSAVFKVPDAAGPIAIVADLRTLQIRTSIDVVAPQEGTLPGRVAWLSKQLKEASDGILVEAHFAPRSETTCERLADVREKPRALIPGKEWEPSSFTVSQSHPMGTRRSGAKGSFVSSVTQAVDSFYAEVVEKIRPWTPPAPQLPDEDLATVPAASKA